VIDGVQVVPLRRFNDDRGSVLLMLKETDVHFLRFGEIYFSTVYAGAVKAWKNHRRMTANYACIHGQIRVVLHDDRDSSPTRGTTVEVNLSPDEYALLVIPPHVWHGFQGVADPVSILANCATEVSDPDELDRRSPDDPLIPYAWAAGE
jgi:dTDP-4-dehydrorhamnose 3,5-epimerase